MNILLSNDNYDCPISIKSINGNNRNLNFLYQNMLYKIIKDVVVKVFIELLYKRQNSK